MQVRISMPANQQSPARSELCQPRQTLTLL